MPLTLTGIISARDLRQTRPPSPPTFRFSTKSGTQCILANSMVLTPQYPNIYLRISTNLTFPLGFLSSFNSNYPFFFQVSERMKRIVVHNELLCCCANTHDSSYPFSRAWIDAFDSAAVARAVIERSDA